ncbi:hypothetical protein ACFLYV_02805 [Chloroflexota bacterium]
MADKPTVLAANFEKGTPQGEYEGKWRGKIGVRADQLKYLKNGERYWYSDDWFGSEKRKTPA